MRLVYRGSIVALLIAACQPDPPATSTSASMGDTSESESDALDGTLGASDTGAGLTTEESATLIMGSTSMPDTSTGPDDDIHHSPGACGNIGPADCTPGDDGWCADVVTLCDSLAPVNTNPRFCQDMGAICEAEHVPPCTICTILQRQCEIEKQTVIDCTDYTETCGCLLDASGV